MKNDNEKIQKEKNVICFHYWLLVACCWLKID